MHDFIDNLFITIYGSTMHIMHNDFRDIRSLNGLCKFCFISSYYFYMVYDDSYNIHFHDQYNVFALHAFMTL